LRRLRKICDVDSRKVDVDVSLDETKVDIVAEDSLHPDRPRTHLTLKDTLEWAADRFDKKDDINPARKLRLRIRKFREFIERNKSDTDTDFNDKGFDETKDETVAEYDFRNNADADLDRISDFGSVDVYDSTLDKTIDPSLFRRVSRSGARFGPSRLSRISLSTIVTNVKNGIGDGEVTRPGGSSFNILLENIPFKAIDSSFVLEFDVDSDADTAVLEDNVAIVDKDSDGLDLKDESEGKLTYDARTRIRWKRRVYCDGTKEVVVRARLVTGVVDDSVGYTVRKRLFITFRISRTIRCLKLLWDPSTDFETPEDIIVDPSTSSPTTGTGSSSPSTGTSSPSTGTSSPSTGTSSPSTGSGSNPNPSTTQSPIDTDTSSSSKLLMLVAFAAILIVLF